MIQADYDSMVSVSYLSLPFLLSFTTAKPGKLSFYFEAGPQVSYAISANSTIKGDYKFLGYYPDHPDVTKYISISELGQGFYDDADIDRQRPAEISNINLSLYGSLGFNIPLGYFYCIQIGPEIVFGISDIQQKNKEYIDIFGNKFDHKSTTVKKFGIRIGLVYKL